MDRYSIGTLVHRIALAGILLFFAYQQITAPSDWVGLIDGSLVSFVSQYFPAVTSSTILMILAGIEILLAILFIIGRLLTIAGFLTAVLFGYLFYIHLLSPVGVRDFAIALFALSIALRR